MKSIIPICVLLLGCSSDDNSREPEPVVDDPRREDSHFPTTSPVGPETLIETGDRRKQLETELRIRRGYDTLNERLLRNYQESELPILIPESLVRNAFVPYGDESDESGRRLVEAILNQYRRKGWNVIRVEREERSVLKNDEGEYLKTVEYYQFSLEGA